jgi:hypothetical protein
MAESESSDLTPGEQQLELWARYPTSTLLARATAGGLVGAGVHAAIGLALRGHVSAIGSALTFGLLLFCFGAGTSWWARRQARRGRRVWWLANPDR